MRRPAAPRAAGRPDVQALAAGVLATAATAVVVGTAVVGDLASDFRAHVQFTANGLRTSVFPANPLFYWLDALFAGFSPARGPLLRALVIVLALATGIKVWLTVRFVAAESGAGPGAQGRGVRRGRLPWWVGVAAGLCALAFSLPTQRLYLGQLPPNVFHNSTTMLLMPFAVGLFWVSLSYLRTGSRRLLWWVLLLAALNVAAKPSLVLCFLVVFPLAALACLGRGPAMVRAWFATAAVAAMVALQSVYIYLTAHGDPDRRPGRGPSGVALDPLHVWSAYSHNVALSVLASYLFPLVALALGGSTIRRAGAVRYAGALAAVGLLCFLLLTETGPRELHGNFMWQAVVTNYLLFAALVAAVARWVRQSGWGPRQAAVVVAFGLHVLAGGYFLYHWLSTGSYH